MLAALSKTRGRVLHGLLSQSTEFARSDPPCLSPSGGKPNREAETLCNERCTVGVVVVHLLSHIGVWQRRVLSIARLFWPQASSPSAGPGHHWRVSAPRSKQNHTLESIGWSCGLGSGDTEGLSACSGVSWRFLVCALVSAAAGPCDMHSSPVVRNNTSC